jgi:hypothetical protein
MSDAVDHDSIEVDEAFLAAQPAAERDQLIIRMLERVDQSLNGLSPMLKVLMTLKTASAYAIAGGVGLKEFLFGAEEMFNETAKEVAQIVSEREAAPAEAPATAEPEVTS